MNDELKYTEADLENAYQEGRDDGEVLGFDNGYVDGYKEGQADLRYRIQAELIR